MSKEHEKIALVALGLLGTLLTGCSSCSDSGAAKDASSGDSSTVDKDADADTDEDVETDSDSETDTTPWAWNDLPPSEDCGPGCRQLTYGDKVYMLNWDVWGDLLVFLDESHAVKVVDVKNRKIMRIPDVHEEYPINGYDGPTGAFSPVVYQNRVAYSQTIIELPPAIVEVVAVDLTHKSQEVIYHRQGSGDSLTIIAKGLDIYENRIVSQGGCLNDEYHHLCLFTLPGPSEDQVIVEGNYGSYNSIWQDTMVWYS